MAKSKTTKDEEQKVLELEYKTALLPSAQHKTGLAGLVFLVRTMEERGMAPLPEITRGEGESWIIRFTRDNFQALFDELYDAEKIMIESKSRWSGQEPVDTVEKTTEREGKTETEKYFVYSMTVPKGAALRGVLPEGDEGDKKLKLWRDMLWATYRGKPTTRGVYEERVQGSPCSFTEGDWKTLLKDMNKSKEIPGTYLLGSERFNAEKVLSRGTLKESLLLHFSHIACPLFLSRIFQIKRGKGEGGSAISLKREESGYVIVMPEIVDVDKYVGKYRKWLGSDLESSKYHRPVSALIDLPEEGGLEFLSSITEYRVETKGRGIFDTVEGAEYYHMEKKGNAVNLLASAYVPLSRDVLVEYSHLVAPGGKKRPLNFLYKTCRIRNILDGTPWYTGMQEILEQYPSELFVWSKDGTPGNTPFFGNDIRRRFTKIAEDIEYTREAKDMGIDDAGAPAVNRDDRLAAKTRDIVRRYVISELKERVKKELLPNDKTHLEKKEEGDSARYSVEYQEAVKKICNGAFLALRGRKGSDIAEYFTGTLCSHPQFMKSSPKNEDNDEFILIARALVDPEEREKIKLFAMLALSACSYVYSKDEQPQAETE
ncbi:MAG: type I-MYXAN CRISPR-associated protein Cmx8 [Synergistaceae bacterium]|nr:type I-MYXAN CRISPR-associated protein Cmx8 [Synergistota bacterium]NLM70364.1 type I-MYXAN CRISPR-associated protein Cmx8 [Synergistaceae bacterium]